MASRDSDVVLVIGGTAKVGGAIVELLKQANVSVVAASRSGKGPEGVTRVAMDWFDEATWARSFETVQAPITAVFITAPPTIDSAPIMNRFIDFAREKGVKRFVLLSARQLEPHTMAMGKTHGYLKDLGDRGEVEWAVLRPTWFQQNFSTQDYHVKTIREDGAIYSATGDGGVPFISTSDIAAVGVVALTSKEAPNRDYVLLGEELLSFRDICSIISKVTGKTITYHSISEDERTERYMNTGLPEDYARMLTSMETDIKNGNEASTNDVVFAVTGRHAQTFREVAKRDKAAWL